MKRRFSRPASLFASRRSRWTTFCQRLRRQGVAITNDPTDQPWGERRLSITDPNGIIINYYSTITVGHEP